MPGSGAWWALRPVWLVVYLLALLPFALGFGRFERSAAGDRLHRHAGLQFEQLPRRDRDAA